MAKISTHGGPTDVNAAPGDTAQDALLRTSALHPEEQEARPLLGEGDDEKWLKTDEEGNVVRNDDGEPEYGRQGETVRTKDDEEGDRWGGTNFSASSEKLSNSEKTSSNDPRQPAPSTESLSSQADAQDPSTASSADTSGRSSRGKTQSK